MAKRAIYLDDRERELARRVFDFAMNTIASEHGGGPVSKFARCWTTQEIRVLRSKFEDPDQS